MFPLSLSVSLNIYSQVCIISYLTNASTWKDDVLCSTYLFWFRLFLTFKGPNTLFFTDTINPLTAEVDAVLSISNLTVDGKKKHCFHFYLFFSHCMLPEGLELKNSQL